MYSANVSDDGKYLLVSVSNSCDPVNKLYYTKIEGDVADIKSSENGVEVVKLINEIDAGYTYLTN